MSAPVPLPPPSEENRQCLQHREHPHCFACGTVEGSGGLALAFQVDPTHHGVTAAWSCPAAHCSYADTVHGGVLATLVDSAMVHALFAQGVVARTAELCIRYRHPVATEHPLTVTACLRQHLGRLLVLDAAITQDGRRCVAAEAKFMSAA
ncbi:PaaI family thioesterase [Actomonas aquatica]|uniref:PaaI family thioesterase n=1 Tax=Actomonas aquatica TaxID=2866162 RepID=A0ABZ1C416_9BACT|nr:PaaI family thioesterase [Opitutus sp. WL0086]WRQ86335.1 PaaI family thioesterase [Opitutus sp. WL0086]